MDPSWTFAVGRDELTRTTVVDAAAVDIADGEALLRVERVGMTANNVTYAVLGDAFGYWRFFPAEPRGLEPSWGIVPLWGFASVVESRAPGVEAGQRVYGYLPSASHLVVRPARVDDLGFRDGSPHRAELPSPYNAYRLTSTDDAYRADEEDLLVLFRPLFVTSFMLADYLADNDFFGAATVVLSSASSKTAYAAAHELRGQGPRVVGLTSPGNVAFTESLGCYDQVLAYDQVASLEPKPAVYLDLSGAPATRAALRAHLGDRLVRDIAVGLTRQEPNIEAAGEFFFAPDQMRKRAGDWGRGEVERRSAAAWRRFADALGAQVEVRVGHGPEALRAAWSDAVAGRTPARVGQVIQL
ncbi:DUF2855 family protein [Asanoa sp. WMMD1127]|uniref:DUF2855 family protein n=1 Tax=Asanoa sp. WMMD1127 TaxID=3016107 RepID=UPI002417D423|nr:DUF2855 family protein [Asanoa sp. WMMD1127]MDG4823354.1 DUF2855 family protein [Asanoa sp. WMMD1127]